MHKDEGADAAIHSGCLDCCHGSPHHRQARSSIALHGAAGNVQFGHAWYDLERKLCPLPVVCNDRRNFCLLQETTLKANSQEKRFKASVKGLLIVLVFECLIIGVPLLFSFDL